MAISIQRVASVENVRAAAALEEAVADPAADTVGLADVVVLADVVASGHGDAEAEEVGGQAVVDDGALLLEAVGVELGHGAQAAAAPTAAAIGRAAGPGEDLPAGTAVRAPIERAAGIGRDV